MEPGPYPPIADYALLSDCHSAALVSRDGSVDWCCFDRFDARPVFGRLLDRSRGGHFRIAPRAAHTIERRYLPETNVLETRFETERGVLVLVDCLAVHERAHRDAVDPYRQLIRLLRCEAGELEVELDFAPRFDYGLTTPAVRRLSEQLALVVGGADALVLQSDLGIHGDGSAVRTLRAGDSAHAVVTYGRPHQVRAELLSPGRVARRVNATLRFWREWSSRCSYEGPYRDQVLRSALVLKGLTNAPTGALVAAPTTSLPEEIGGVRNWDYRYTWLRDSAFILYALNTLGYTDEARAFIRWLERTVAGRAEDLQVMYGVGGERMLPEVELPELEGYRGSRPGAHRQRGRGPVPARHLRRGGRHDLALPPLRRQDRAHRLGAAHRARRLRRAALDRAGRRHLGGPRAAPALRLLEGDGVGGGRPRDPARAAGSSDPVRSSAGSRFGGRCARASRARGWTRRAAAFVQAFGSTAVDASALLIPEVGFVPRDDPRVRATVDRIERELCRDGFVYRYRDTDDGLAGGEGAFLICSFWLVDNLVFSGRRERARELFERLTAHANDLGLMAEQFDPVAGMQLGNFPQAFSHMGLINSAIQLAGRTTERRRSPAGRWRGPRSHEGRLPPRRQPPRAGRLRRRAPRRWRARWTR